MKEALPEGFSVRKAVQWIAEEKKLHPDKKYVELVNEAAMKFDLSPKEEEMILRFYLENRSQ